MIEETAAAPFFAARQLLRLAGEAQRSGYRQEAYDARQAALRKQEEALHQTDADIAELVALARLHINAMDYDAAYPLYLLCLQLVEVDAEAGPVVQASALNQLDFMCLKSQRLEEAEGYLRRSLETKIGTDADPATDVAPTLNNLAEAYLGLGRLNEANGYLQEALRIRQEEQKPLRLAITHATLAALRWQQGRREEALEISTQALQVHAEAAWPNCFYVEALRRHAAMLRNLQRPEEALTLEMQAKQMEEEVRLAAWA